jgi:D-alanyl-lipoteichoic acid acyltransferase DltB (MBOAT superfamily)
VLFNSYEYLFVFLPLMVAICLSLSRLGKDSAAMTCLVAGSLFFYAWWDYRYLPLLLASISCNYLIAVGLFRSSGSHRSAWLLGLGVLFNLGLLAYYKYAGFFLSNAGFDGSFALASLVLPLGISFFTFQQIAYLVDVRRGEAARCSLRDYALFVSFFPQLISGPIVHHKEMMPQFRSSTVFDVNATRFACALTYLGLGLFKKVCIADEFATFATPLFDSAENGYQLTTVEAWTAAVAYTFQIYFDFSGYVDMAMGAALMFGIRLPLNFDSPYKATSIIDFWRRWHMTLSRFLRDYLYIPMGGNRRGSTRRHLNLMITMVLGGLWHGAGWTFIVWGAVHGGMLVINHAWRNLIDRLPGLNNAKDRLPFAGLLCRWLSWSITFLAVVFSWVYFRAESMDSAGAISLAMLGQAAWGDPPQTNFVLLAAVCLVVVAAAPNSHRIVDQVASGFSTGAAWRIFRGPALPATLLGLVTIAAVLGLSRRSEFLYFQF